MADSKDGGFFRVIVNVHGFYESCEYFNLIIMPKSLSKGDCVKIPDGRIGRLREKIGSSYKVRVRRLTSKSHQFLMFSPSKLKKAPCPKGWMSPEGYNRYLKETMTKMHQREKRNPKK
jgi:ribosomal protein L21E